MGDSLMVDRFKVVCEGTADLAQNLEWRDGPSPRVGVLQQRAECFARMGVGDGTPQRTPQPLDAVGLRIIRRRINQHELPTLLFEEVSQHMRSTQDRSIHCGVFCRDGTGYRP